MEEFKSDLQGLFNEQWLIPLLYSYLPKFTYRGEELTRDNVDLYLEKLKEHIK